MDKLSIRSYIKTRLLLGLTATQIYEELTAAYGQDVVSYSTVAHWVHRFSSGREWLEDDPRHGRPITVVTQQNIDAVKGLVKDDPHISIDYIADILDISHGSVDTILKQHLKLKKISSRWVPHKLTQQQRQQRVDICIENLQKFESGAWRLGDIITGDESWFYHRKIKSKQESKAWLSKGQHPPTEVRRQQFEKKTMFVIFFMTTGPLLIHQLPSGTFINALYYRDECLKSLVRKLHKKRPSSTTNGIKLHHDNARPHMNDIVFDYLQEEKIKVMAHPPYSPDLAPSDFWLFNYLKRSLGTYPDATSLGKAITKELNSISIQEYQKTFQKWIQRMKFCIEHHGDYFEHLL
jgi:[histone H3]-lysine36 N-dimethyltransferase SETMAR